MSKSHQICLQNTSRVPPVLVLCSYVPGTMPSHLDHCITWCAASQFNLLPAPASVLHAAASTITKECKNGSLFLSAHLLIWLRVNPVPPVASEALHGLAFTDPLFPVLSHSLPSFCLSIWCLSPFLSVQNALLRDFASAIPSAPCSSPRLLLAISLGSSIPLAQQAFPGHPTWTHTSSPLQHILVPFFDFCFSSAPVTACHTRYLTRGSCLVSLFSTTD